MCVFVWWCLNYHSLILLCSLCWKIRDTVRYLLFHFYCLCSQKSTNSTGGRIKSTQLTVKSMHPQGMTTCGLSQRTPRQVDAVLETQWARYLIPVSWYERKIVKFTAHCTHTIKIIRFNELCLQSKIQRAPCAQRRIWIGTSVGFQSHQLRENHNAPIATQAQRKSYAWAKS